jgi:hypothetical protein
VPLYTFKTNDIFVNQIESEVRQEFYVYNGSVYYDKKRPQSGSFASSVVSSTGTISLFEENVDRSSDKTGFIYPYVVKSNSFVAFRDVSDTEFAASYSYGQAITGTYPLTASISRAFYSQGSDRPRITALKNTLNYYGIKSTSFRFSSSTGDKATMPINLVSVPNIFYGSRLTKRSISLQYYITGTLIGELQDVRGNGELVQVGPSGSTGSGSVAGVVLYDEGFMILTGAWDIVSQTYDYPDSPGVADQPKWIYFGTGLNDGNISGVETSSSYRINFDGTNYVPNITMLCTAQAGQLDHSNNPTFLEYGQSTNTISSISTLQFIEKEFDIKNTLSSSYVEQTASYEKQVFISKIGIYDENENLIAVAKLAKPVRKTSDRDYTFKLKLDL